jgi:hypothetical protein
MNIIFHLQSWQEKGYQFTTKLVQLLVILAKTMCKLVV